MLQSSRKSHSPRLMPTSSTEHSMFDSSSPPQGSCPICCSLSLKQVEIIKAIADVPHPVILLSAGASVTLLVSILNTITNSALIHHRIHFSHGSHSSQARAFKDHAQALERKFPRIRVTFAKPVDQRIPGLEAGGEKDLQISPRPRFHRKFSDALPKAAFLPRQRASVLIADSCLLLWRGQSCPIHRLSCR